MSLAIAVESANLPLPERRLFAADPKTTCADLEILMRDYDHQIRAAVAQHRNSTSDMLRQLAQDPELDVAKAANANPNKSPYIFPKARS
jgi:hypothetical protein